jgi:exosortase
MYDGEFEDPERKKEAVRRVLKIAAPLVSVLVVAFLIGYLVYALPLPISLYVKLTQPMQMIAAELGTQLLPLVGGSGERTGTVIYVTFGQVTQKLMVAEACSGMRLLVAFFALAVALGYSSDRPMWQKVTLAVCALPIAVLCNGLRVMLTGYLVVNVSPSWGQGDAHGFFGRSGGRTDIGNTRPKEDSP